MNENKGNMTAEATVEIGGSSVQLKGSESFVKEELSNFRGWVEENAGISANARGTDNPESHVEPATSRSEGEQSSLPVLRSSAGEEEGEHEEFDQRGSSKIANVARSINVDPERLSEHFYIDDDGVGIQDPRNIDPEYALLGYAIIKKELTGQTYLDNTATKKKLIDQEMVDIERWGSKFIYGLRQRGLIKDDPNTDRKRNKPFKITPKGLDEFVNWLEGQNGE